MPKSWTPPETVTPFVELILDYLWSKRPPLSVAQFAAQTGIAKTAIWGWIREGRIPHPTTLDRIAERTGISRQDLYAACGYVVHLVQSEDDGGHDPFADMIARVRRDPRFSAASKQALIDSIMRIEMGEAKAARERMIAQEHEVTAAPAQHDASIYKERPTMLDLPTVPAAPASQGSGERTRRNRQDRRRKAREAADSQIDSQDSQTRHSTTENDTLARSR